MPQKHTEYDIPRSLYPTIIITANNMCATYEEGGAYYIPELLKNNAFPQYGYAKSIVFQDGSFKKPNYVFPVRHFNKRSNHMKSMLFRIQKNDIIITTAYQIPNPVEKVDGYVKFNVFQIQEIQQKSKSGFPSPKYNQLVSWHIKVRHDIERPLFAFYNTKQETSELRVLPFVWHTVHKVLEAKKLDNLCSAVIKTILKSMSGNTTYMMYKSSNLPKRFIESYNKRKNTQK
jgi:hypothetical protein